MGYLRNTWNVVVVISLFTIWIWIHFIVRDYGIKPTNRTQIPVQIAGNINWNRLASLRSCKSIIISCCQIYLSLYHIHLWYIHMYEICTISHWPYTAKARDQSRYAPSKWETSLHCNDISHWLSAHLDRSLIAVLLKYGRPVAKCDPWIQRATQGPTMDGPFGDQWLLYVLQKIFRNKSGKATPQMDALISYPWFSARL